MLKKQTMRVDTLERICDTLEITMVDLFEGNLDATTTITVVIFRSFYRDAAISGFLPGPGRFKREA